MIQDRLNRLKPYFKGIKVAEHFNIVEFNLKKEWLIQEKNGIDVQQKSLSDNKQTGVLYNMFYSDSKTFDEILNYVEDEVIAHNLELEQKETLLRAKVEELKRVFEDKSLVELNGLKFTTSDNSLKLGTSKKPTAPPSKIIKEGEDPRPKLKPEYLNDLDNKNKIKQNGSSKELSKNS
jgi:hypothetical protein